MKKVTIRLLALLLPAFLMIGACSDDYGDQLRSLGKRVEWLEENMQKVNLSIENLNKLITAIQKRGYITNYIINPDGSCTLTFNDGRTFTLQDGKDGADGRDGVDGVDGKDGRDGHDGRNGRDGKDAQLSVGVWQDIDGQWYWTLNGDWLLDANGNKVRAGSTDGKDGKDGNNGNNGYVPLMRINDDGIWEVSTDGGKTWQSTGSPANGKDGKDGRADRISNVTLSDDGKYLIITLADEVTTFSIPLLDQ